MVVRVFVTANGVDMPCINGQAKVWTEVENPPFQKKQVLHQCPSIEGLYSLQAFQPLSLRRSR